MYFVYSVFNTKIATKLSPKNFNASQRKGFPRIDYWWFRMDTKSCRHRSLFYIAYTFWIFSLSNNGSMYASIYFL